MPVPSLELSRIMLFTNITEDTTISGFHVWAVLGYQ